MQVITVHENAEIRFDENSVAYINTDNGEQICIHPKAVNKLISAKTEQIARRIFNDAKESDKGAICICSEDRFD